MTELLHVDNLCLSLHGGQPVFEHLGFSVESGEAVGLVGPSGSGKSLTTFALLGLLPPQVCITSGTATYQRKDGHAVDLLREPERSLKGIRGREIGLVFQEPQSALNPVVSCGCQLLETVRVTGTDECPHTRVDELLGQVGLQAERDRLFNALPARLSGGQLQRLLIAMALAGRPRLLIADEPTTALDSLTEREIILLLDRLRRDLGMGLLLISHDEGLVSRVADREVRLAPAGGRIIALGGAGAGAESTGALRDSGDPVLRLEDVQIGFADREEAVVTGCTFDVRAGEWVALMGRSGCGKSTVGNWLAGMVPAIAGTLSNRSGSIPANSSGAAIRRMTGAQMIFQDVFGSLNPTMTVAEAIGEVLSPETGDTVQSLLRSVDLSPEKYAKRLPSRLSGGERQRVAIARALAAAPCLLICDEALSGLDVPLRREVQMLLQRECRKRNIAVVLITHDLRTALECADLLLLMEDGRIVERGDPRLVLEHPTSELGRRFAETLL